MRRLLLLLPLVLGIAVLTLPPSSGAWTDAASNDGNRFATRQPIRATTYQITAGFTGNTYGLALDNDLAADYFVIMRGAAGNNTNAGNVTPDANSARVTADPHGNFATTTASNVLRLGRIGTQNDWQGQVTVVESLEPSSADGFVLRGVAEVFFDDPDDAGTGAYGPDFATANVTAWGSLGQVAVYGGSYGGGVTTQADTVRDHITAWGMVSAAGSNTVEVYRYADNTNPGGHLNGDTVFTVYAVEWGADWTIQSVIVTGSSGGNGVNAPGEYDTGAINPVARANTFVTASGRSIDNGLGDGWEGTIWTLGDGVTQNLTENRVAVGQEYTDTRQAQFFIHTHGALLVDYRFGPDGSISTNGLSGSQAVDAASAPATATRIPLISNSSNGTGNAYPRPIVWARHSGDTTLTWTRSRAGQPGAYWVQSIDFGELWRD